MTKRSNVKTVTASFSCDDSDFKCTLVMDGGSELYFNGLRGVGMFLEMLDIYENKETVH